MVVSSSNGQNDSIDVQETEERRFIQASMALPVIMILSCLQPALSCILKWIFLL
jgi:hypothetical protein